MKTLLVIALTASLMLGAAPAVAGSSSHEACATGYQWNESTGACENNVLLGPLGSTKYNDINVGCVPGHKITKVVDAVDALGRPVKRTVHLTCQATPPELM